jgi:periplasmic divalent cation tolerance protein
VTEAIIIQCTVSSKEQARRIGRALVEARLAACASIVGDVESHYRWQGAIERAVETLLVVKTTRQRFDDVCRTILEHHSYDVPEIIAVPIAAGHNAYLAWLAESVGGEEAGR